jgi:rhomboid protease GluP
LTGCAPRFEDGRELLRELSRVATKATERNLGAFSAGQSMLGRLANACMIEVPMETRRMCPHCRAFITTGDRVCPYCNEPVAPKRMERPQGAILGGLIPHAGYLTVIILLINTGMYLATVLYSNNSGGGGNFLTADGRTVLIFGAKRADLIALGQWWRLIMAGYLHFGVIHILMNMWVLFDLGAQVEQIYGGARMLVIYFVANIVGFYASAVFYPYVASAGASAALFGLVGAMLAIGIRYRGSPAGDMIRSVYMRYMVYLILFSFIPGVDLAAHIGGLIGGFGIGYLADRPQHPGSWIERFWHIAAGGAIAITGFSFLKWYLWFRTFSQ